MSARVDTATDSCFCCIWQFGCYLGFLLVLGEEIIENYISELDKVFDMINKCENGTNINDLLEGPTCHGGFKRLN